MATTLKNGTVVEDARLDRLVQFDERSRAFPIRAAVGDKPFRSYTWRCTPRLDQGPDGACFPAGTLVRMIDGSHKPIDKIDLHDVVVTAEGNAGPVVQTMTRQAEGLVRVKLRGNNALSCTAEHPILTKRGYVPAAELNPDDYVAQTRGPSRLDSESLMHWSGESSDFIQTSDVVNLSRLRGTIEGTVNTGGVESRVTRVPEMIGKTPAFGRILGLYAAEGHVTENKVVWTFGGHEEDTLVAELSDLLKSMLDIEARVQKRPNGAVNVVVYGKAWRLLFEALVPGTAKYGDKALSKWAAAGKPEYLRGILYGWLDGDGHRRRTSYEGISVAHRLALDMHAIATDLGLRPTLNVSKPSVNRHAATRQDRWSVTIPEGEGQNLPKQDDAAVWRKVTEVTVDEEWSGWVYNMHVEGDESYVAEGVGVHNCVGFSMAHEIAARPKELPADYNLAMNIYREAQKIDEWPGENYEGTSVLAGVKMLHRFGYVEQYRWAFGLDDLVLAVGYQGPAVVGSWWYEEMFDPRDCGRIHVGGNQAGGHAYLINGVSVADRTFTIHNSWGAGWGVNGESKISWDDMDMLLEEDGEACIPMVRAWG